MSRQALYSEVLEACDHASRQGMEVTVRRNTDRTWLLSPVDQPMLKMMVDDAFFTEWSAEDAGIRIVRWLREGLGSWGSNTYEKLMAVTG